jgi:peptidoglycan/LPS O-acetylase OafA/YrhL
MISRNGTVKEPLLFSVFLLLLPLTFLYQGTSKIDRSIGELSCPIYICHLLVIRIISAMSEQLNMTNLFAISCASLFMSIMFAYFLNRDIGDRVEKLRSKIRGIRIKSGNQPLLDRIG